MKIPSLNGKDNAAAPQLAGSEKNPPKDSSGKQAITADSITGLLEALRTDNPTSPRLTWYGTSGERVELSGRVLENWVAKTANFLVEELDAERETTVGLDMPMHWRSLVFSLATWAAGASVLIPDTASAGKEFGSASQELSPAIIVTSDPNGTRDRWASASDVVAVALPALAMRWDGELPQGCIDYTEEVRSYSDVFYPFDSADGDDTAWISSKDGSSASYAELFARPRPSRERVLVTAESGWVASISDVVSIWASGGSIVLLESGAEAPQSLIASENITETL